MPNAESMPAAEGVLFSATIASAAAAKAPRSSIPAAMYWSLRKTRTVDPRLVVGMARKRAQGTAPTTPPSSASPQSAGASATASPTNVMTASRFGSTQSSCSAM